MTSIHECLGAGGGPDLNLVRVATRSEYLRFQEQRASQLAADRLREEQLWRSHLERGRPVRFSVPGWCYPCDARSWFELTDHYSWEVDGELVPNWREHLRCRRCGLNNRMRATVHLLEVVLKAGTEQPIYITEQNTPLFRALAGRFHELTGSEFLRDGTACGQTNGIGIRHEDVTDLTFPDGQFDHVITLDVLEHVPVFGAALAEIHRVLKPGGRLFLTVPFLVHAESTLVRARVRSDGSVEHLVPPEYHGDPCCTDGCLAFYHFGWDLLDHLLEAGFSDVHVLVYSAVEHCYFGADQMVFLGYKERLSE